MYILFWLGNNTTVITPYLQLNGSAEKKQGELTHTIVFSSLQLFVSADKVSFVIMAEWVSYPEKNSDR